MPPLLVAFVSLVLLGAASLHAYGQQQSLSQMLHSSWSGRDGAPQAISAIAQTPDGLLWIGSRRGLYTFDGLSFSPFQSAANGIPFPLSAFHFLLATRSGDVWAFGYHGAPSRIHDGLFSVFAQTDGPSIEVMSYPQQDSDGNLFAILNERQIVHLGQDGIWHRIPSSVPGTVHITLLFVDSSNTLWAVENDRLYRLPHNGRSFTATNTFVYGGAGIGEGPAKDLWITSEGLKTSSAAVTSLQHVNRLGQMLPAPEVKRKLSGVLPAQDGSLWILTADNLLLHLRKQDFGASSESPATPTQESVQLGAGAEAFGDHSFFRGADGSIWSGGLGGLEHFAKATLVAALDHAPVGEWDSCIDAQGSVWIASPKGTLLQGEDDHFKPRRRRYSVEEVFCSPSGRLILRDDAGIALLSGDHFERLPLLPGLTGYSNHYIFTGAAALRDGSILAAAAGGAIGHSLWKYTATGWERVRAVDSLPEITALHPTASGQILLGFRGRDPALLYDGALTALPGSLDARGATIGFSETTYGIFAYGTEGIALREGDVLKPLHFVNPQYASVITGLAEDRGGDLWLNGSAGVVRIPVEEVRAALANVEHQIVSVNVAEGDLVGPAMPGAFSNSVQMDRRGRIWFSTLNGVVYVDPQHLRSTPPPRLSIQSVRADGSPLGLSGDFPPEIQTLSIKYIGVDLTHPRGVSYQYQLHGLDKDWQDAGSRTEAIYAHLRPGRYRFEVRASNSYGVWTDTVSSPTFTVSPHLYQTFWFQIVCGSAVLLIVWVCARARLTYIAADIRSRAEERAEERISIARDLHDTLLQGVQGLLLTFHAAAERVPPEHESKQALERALVTADKLILAGRDRVKGLRGSSLSYGGLSASLEALGEELNSTGRVEYTVTCSTEEKMLQAHVATEIFLIAREAIMNAFRHADASQILVDVRYGRRELSFSCKDNGCGFNAAALTASEESGHWGVTGMIERANQLGALFEYRSSVGHGTTILFSLKARRAYE